MRALLVEDSATCAIDAVEILRRHGCRFVRLRSARGARGAMLGEAFDIAIIDVNIPEAERVPGVDALGLEVARELRARMPSCRVVLWSGDAEAHRAAAAEIGVEIVAKGDAAGLERALGFAP